MGRYVTLARHRAPALALLTALATGMTACSGNTAGTLCGVPLDEIIVSTLIVDTDTTTLIELSFTRARSEELAEDDEEPVEDLGSLFLCDGDEVTINGIRARPIERAPGEPVYSATPNTTAPQYTIALELGGSQLEYTAQEQIRALDLIAPDPFLDWNAIFRRSEPMNIAWTQAAQEDDPVAIELRDEVDGRPCLAPFEPIVLTSGDAYELPPHSLAVDEEAGVDESSECPAFLRLSREGVVEMLPRSSNQAELSATPARAVVLHEVRILSQS